ncbi:hypothetical protein SAMN03159341_103586 [Paenibacillus sp. 1_12]|uniref:hypothetical protein n=1 Tax=Paenibacillus sp. 1_12 TaxID=1566278 RepID=UPI0008E54A88|nr:hypothetical protein [Paenibacillus sp. 1_12]SFL16740.1 hypothetical protein SAMN03159341_103586 [Paenibacillus sp. 1_12]
MDIKQNTIDRRRFLFNVDILIESESNGRALEKLLHLLNTSEVQDYLVKEGIHLGKTIEVIMRETISKQQADTHSEEKPDITKENKPLDKAAAATKKNSAASPAKLEDPHQPIWDQFQSFKERNSLVRLTIVKAKGIKLSLPCRILNVDAPGGMVSVYHVDEKQVYLFKINEIDDFAVSS